MVRCISLSFMWYIGWVWQVYDCFIVLYRVSYVTLCSTFCYLLIVLRKAQLSLQCMSASLWGESWCSVLLLREVSYVKLCDKCRSYQWRPICWKKQDKQRKKFVITNDFLGFQLKLEQGMWLGIIVTRKIRNSLIGLYGCVQPQRVWVFSRFGIKYGMVFARLPIRPPTEAVHSLHKLCLGQLC